LDIDYSATPLAQEVAALSRIAFLLRPHKPLAQVECYPFVVRLVILNYIRLLRSSKDENEVSEKTSRPQ
jgi:hypothetical protein